MGLSRKRLDASDERRISSLPMREMEPTFFSNSGDCASRLVSDSTYELTAVLMRGSGSFVEFDGGSGLIQGDRRNHLRRLEHELVGRGLNLWRMSHFARNLLFLGIGRSVCALGCTRGSLEAVMPM